MDADTSCELAAVFVRQAAPGLGWSVKSFKRARFSCSRYVYLERDGVVVCVRVSDHRSKRRQMDRQLGVPLFQVLRSVLGVRLHELPAFLAQLWSARTRGLLPAGT